MPTNHLEFRSSMDDSAFFRSLRQMEAQTKETAGKIGKSFETVSDELKVLGAAGIAGFGLAIKGAVDFASAISDSASALDLTTENFQGYVGVLEKSGVSQERFESGMVRLKKAIEDAKAGNVDLVNTFDKLGVSWDLLASGSAEDVLKGIATGLSQASDAGAAFNAATDIFGKASQKLVAALKANGSEFEENTKLVSKLTDEQVEKLDALGDSWSELVRKMKVGISTPVTAIKDLIELLHGDDESSFAQSAKVYTPNPFGPKSAPPPDGFAGLSSMTGPKDPRRLKAEEDLDKQLKQDNEDSQKWHDEREKISKDEMEAHNQAFRSWQQLHKMIDERADLMKREVQEAKEKKLGLLQENMSLLRERRDSEFSKAVAFNLTPAGERREQFRDQLRFRRAESRAKREVAARSDPSRRFHGPAFERQLGGDLAQVALDDKSIDKLALKIEKLIVAP